FERSSSVNLYLQPPNITQLDYDGNTRLVKWAVQYSEAQQLAIGAGATAVDRSGEMVVSSMPAKPQITFRAEGYLYRQFAALNLLGYTLGSIQQFRSWTFEYSQYTYTRWQWATKDLSNVKLQITEDGMQWYVASLLSSGAFEYVSTKPIAKAQLTGNQADGSAICLVLDGGAW